MDKYVIRIEREGRDWVASSPMHFACGIGESAAEAMDRFAAEMRDRHVHLSVADPDSLGAELRRERAGLIRWFAKDGTDG